VLRAAQGNLDVLRGPSFNLASGFAELIKITADPRDETEILPNDIFATVASDFQQELAKVDFALRKSVPTENRMELMILRKECLELRMYKETAHQRPHFHIEYKNEYKASYALDNFERLAGDMPRRYEDAIMPIARHMQNQLNDRWQSLNGTSRIRLPGD
jgi:hypothetical protein